MINIKTKFRAIKTAVLLGEIQLAWELTKGTGYILVEHKDNLRQILFTSNNLDKMKYVAPEFTVEIGYKYYSLVKVPHNARCVGSNARKVLGTWGHD